MEHQLVLGLAAIVVLGMAAQWLADSLRLPSILLLLLTGFLAGPVAGVIDPDLLFGQLLPPLVGLDEAVILFDGGLSLRLSELRDVGKVVRRLITLGILVTMGVGAVAAVTILGVTPRIALLLATILTVSGPTVILPLLRHLRPRGKLGPVIKWEGIFNDPIGAVLAVLVFEVIIAGGERQEFGRQVLAGIAQTVLVGGLMGIGAAALTVAILRHYLVAQHLEIPVTVMLVVTAYATSNLVQAESGLLAVTVMGVALANQRSAPVRHIIEFGETVGIFLTSMLFVILAADLEVDQLAELGLPVVGFIAVLVLVARPLAAFVSTIGSELSWKDRTVVAWLAPRGIVAASVASVFAIRLDEAGIEEGGLLVPYVFATIVATAAIYGLTTPVLARRLGVSDASPRGVAIVGGHAWARRIAEALQAADVPVLIVPTNRADLAASRLDGLRAHPGSILEEQGIDEIDLDGIGNVVALTHNDEFNSLAAIRFIEVLGRRNVFQVPADRVLGAETEVTHDLRGRLAFGDAVTFHALDERFAAGARVRRTRLTEEFGFEDLLREHDGEVVPLFLLRGGRLEVVSTGGATPGSGETVIAVVGGSEAGPREEDGADREGSDLTGMPSE